MNSFRTDLYQQVIDEMRLEKLQQEIRNEVLFNMPKETLELFKRYTEKVGQEQEALRQRFTIAVVAIFTPLVVLMGWALINFTGCAR